MSDEVVSGEKGDIESNGNPIAPAAGETAVKGSGSKAMFIVFLCGLAAAILATAAFVYYRTGNLDQYTVNLNKAEKHIAASDDKLEALDREYGEVKASIARLENKQELLHDNIDSLYQNRSNDNVDWALAEIEHLLIIATQELSLDADVNTALAALQAADDRLKDMGDPSVLNARSQILSDINALKSVNAVDTPGMALYMADIITRVEKLPLKKSGRADGDQVNAGKTDGEEEQAPAWKRLLHTVWRELKGLVVISREQDASVLSLVPEQRYYLYQNLRMELDAARLSILQRDTDNLRSSLELVREWLNIYFDTGDAEISNIMVSLDQMAKITLRPKLPDISSSLETLRSLIRERAAPPEPADRQQIEE